MIDAYGRWFPDYPGQQIYQDPQYIAKLNQQQTAPQQHVPQTPAQQPFTPPTIHADIIQINAVPDAEAFQLQPGTSQMFITRDENQIVIREQHQGGYNLSVYDKRPPEPRQPAIDPAQFVTWDKLEERLSQLQGAKPARSALNKGEEK